MSIRANIDTFVNMFSYAVQYCSILFPRSLSNSELCYVNQFFSLEKSEAPESAGLTHSLWRNDTNF